MAALAAGDAATARDATAAAWQHATGAPPGTAALSARLQRAGRTGGRRSCRGPPLGRRGDHDRDGLVLDVGALTRAPVAIAQDEPDQAERDAHDALACAAELDAYLAFPIPWNASPRWPAKPAVTVKPPGFSARQRPSGSAWARCGSRSGTPATKPRWQRCEMQWARRTLTPPGPRALPCPPRRRSPTRSAAAANANARQRLGFTHAHRARRRTTGQRRTGQQRHRHKAFRLTTHRADPPHPRLHQTRPDLARAARPGGSPPQLTVKHPSDLGRDLRGFADVLRFVGPHAG